MKLTTILNRACNPNHAHDLTLRVDKQLQKRDNKDFNATLSDAIKNEAENFPTEFKRTAYFMLGALTSIPRGLVVGYTASYVFDQPENASLYALTYALADFFGTTAVYLKRRLQLNSQKSD